MRTRFAALIAALVGGVPAAAADGLNVSPGLWESTSEIAISLASESEVETVLESRTEITQSCVTPQDHMLDAIELAGPGCSVSDVWVRDPEMSFVLICRSTSMTFYGTMVATAGEDGRSTMARMSLKGRRADGQEIRIRADMNGAMTGPCMG